MFLVTGITGNVGGAAARHLLASGKQVRALVRDRARAGMWANRGVELVKGSWGDAASLTQALKGVEGAYLMMPPLQTPSVDWREAKALLASYREALSNAPPPKIVALSSMGAEKVSGVGLITAAHLLEETLAGLHLPVAFVRAGSFFENYLFGLDTGKAGTLPSFYAPADREVPMIATEDIGVEVTKLLTTDWSGTRVIELGSMLSPDALAAALGEVLGRDVSAQSVPREAWAAALENMGLPKGSTWAYEEMMEAVNSGWIGFSGDHAERVEGSTSAKQVFAAAQAARQPAAAN